jgi:polyhydroxyalkanoate synthesis repressor PhaR
MLYCNIYVVLQYKWRIHSLPLIGYNRLSNHLDITLKILKKYPNRRIYDTSTSEYIKLHDVQEMVLAYVPFQVVDSKTGADLTRSTLIQIISDLESEEHRSLLTNRILEELIRFYGDPMAAVISPIIELQILAFLKQQDKWRSTLAQLATPAPEGAEELLKAYLDSIPK